MTNQEKIKLIQFALGVEQDGLWGKNTQTALDDILAPPAKKQGKGSWYSQYKGKYKWVDTGDKPNSNALGVPDDQQGIALPEKATLGKWFMVTAPNSVTLTLQQTDLGPAKWTGRVIDIAAVAAEKFGYSPANFPTDGVFSWEPLT